MVKLSLKDLYKVIQIGESQLSSSNSTAGALYHYPVLTPWKQPRSSCFSFYFCHLHFPSPPPTHTHNTRHAFRYLRACMLIYFSCVRIFETLWPVTLQALPGSSVPGILQARILEWVAMSSSRGSSWARDWNRVLRLLHCRVSSWPLAPLWKPLRIPNI